MDSLRFYSSNSNPIWAHNGALLSESGERGQPQVWPPSLNSEFHALKGEKNSMHLCAHVFVGAEKMRVWGHETVPLVRLITGGVLI